MKIKGLKQLENKLRNMEKKVAKKVVRNAVRKSQKLTLNAAKANAATMVGGEMGQKIASALKVKAVRKQRRGTYALQVAIDPARAEEFKSTSQQQYTVKKGKNKGQKKNKVYYIPTAIEYGHKKPGGSGFVPAIPFMRAASDATEQARINKMIAELKKGVDKA